MGLLSRHLENRRRVAELTRHARRQRPVTLAEGVTPVLVTVRDRLEPLVQLVEVLEQIGGCEIVLVDNDSAYPPLLSYLERSPHRVIRLGANLGARSAWISGLVAEFGHDRHYVVTDPDVVPDDDCPADFIDRFAELLDRYPDVGRVGFGLRIDDLPDSFARSAEVRAWEGQFWQDEVEPGVYEADIDTTFALYRKGRPVRGSRALRTGFPYVARHLAWYEDPDDPDEEALFYRRRADLTVNSWNGAVLPPHLERLISDRSGGVVQP